MNSFWQCVSSQDDESTNPIDPTEAVMLHVLLPLCILCEAMYFSFGQYEIPHCCVSGLVSKGHLLGSEDGVCDCLQAGALRALPALDRETAEDLRRRQQSHDTATTSGLDDTPPAQQREPTPALASQTDDSERQHVLLRPIRPERRPFGSAPAPDKSSASIWDSYDADEEAAVLAMSSAQSVDYKTHLESSIDRPSDSNRSRRGQVHDKGRNSASSTHASSSPLKPSSTSSPSKRQAMNSAETVLEDTGSADSSGGSLARMTEEDMDPFSPIYM